MEFLWIIGIYISLQKTQEARIETLDAHFGIRITFTVITSVLTRGLDRKVTLPWREKVTNGTNQKSSTRVVPDHHFQNILKKDSLTPIISQCCRKLKLMPAQYDMDMYYVTVWYYELKIWTNAPEFYEKQLPKLNKYLYWKVKIIISILIRIIVVAQTLHCPSP